MTDKRTEYVKGLKAAIPVILGFVPVGIAYAIMARQAGFTVFETILMSLTVFAGASHWALGGRQTIGYCINPDWYVGVGAGFISNLNPSGNDVNIAPLYLNARWYWKDRRWSPFVDMSAGYAFATSTGTGGGAYVAPLVGINYHIKGRLSLDLGLGYLYEGCTCDGVAFNQHSPEIRIGLRY